jgi:hypothetical protein
MEVKIKHSLLLAAIFLSACANQDFRQRQITDVYVEDFGSEDIERCRPSDVDLSHHEAKAYFLRARQVEYSVIHDHYNYAPCYIEGTLKYRSGICEWEIRAGATGHIKCGDKTRYFVCDTCDDLFHHK